MIVMPAAGPVLVGGLVAITVGGLLSAGRRSFAAGLAVQAAGACGVGVAGFWLLAVGGTVGAGFTDALRPRLGVDGLSAVFLGTLGLIAAAALVFSVRYLRPDRAGRATPGRPSSTCCTGSPTPHTAASAICGATSPTSLSTTDQAPDHAAGAQRHTVILGTSWSLLFVGISLA